MSQDEKLLQIENWKEEIAYFKKQIEDFKNQIIDLEDKIKSRERNINVLKHSVVLTSPQNGSIQSDVQLKNNNNTENENFTL